MRNLVAYPASWEGYTKEELLNLCNSVSPINLLGKPNFAFQILKDGESYLSPWSTEFRNAQAMSLIRESYSNPILELFALPKIQAKMIENEGTIIPLKPHIITHTWQIPPRWFALFDKGDCLSGSQGNRRFIIYRANLKAVIKRGSRALTIIRKTFGPGPISAEVEELISWLASFDEKSIVELDYGGLAEILESMGMQGVEADTSVQDVWESLEALEIGDGVRAGDAYSRLMNRWRAVSSLEHAN